MKLKVLILFSLISTVLFGQFYEKSRYSGVGVPFFEVEVFRTFKSDGTNLVYVFNEILYDDLSFVKGIDQEFLADFELVIAIFDKNSDQVTSKNIRKKISEKDFKETNSRDRKIAFSNSFELSPGEYEFKLQMNDLNSKKTINRNVNVILPNISSNRVIMSDLLLLDEIEFDTLGNAVNFIPRIKNNFPVREGEFYLYFNLLTQNAPDSFKIKYELISGNQDNNYDSTFTLYTKNLLSNHYFNIDKKKLLSNSYEVVLTVLDHEPKVKRNKKLSFYWVTTPETGADLGLALRQMRYIVTEDSLEFYQEKSVDEQKVFFNRYWKSRDPNPNTTSNELMEEYYKRVNLANREYSTFNQNGWLTDRGRILIKFGFPDDIERHPFEINSVPYVVWRYYRLRKIFVFADRTGFGDYQLLPEYMDQEWR